MKLHKPNVCDFAARSAPEPRHLGRRLIEAIAFAAVVAVVAVLVVVALVPVLCSTHFVIVRGSSMEPAIPLGSVELIAPVHTNQLAVGDVVMFRSPGQPFAVLTHRIASISPDGTMLATKGDGNATVDPSRVPVADVVGRYRFSVPYAGYLLAWGSGRAGRLALIGLPAALVVALEAWTIVVQLRHHAVRAAVPPGS